MYDAQLGRFHTIDPLADIQEDFTPYHYVYNNPLKFTDPSGMLPEHNQDLSSTFVDSDNNILEHRDDGDARIFRVNDVKAWKKRGKTKDGLSLIGIENPNYDYKAGEKFNQKDNRQNLWANYASGAIEPDYTLESLYIPLARGLGWAGGYVMKLVNKGGKWVFEIVEIGTNRVIGRFAAKQAINSFDDIIVNPQVLWGKSADEIAEILGEGWKRGSYGSSGNGWKFTKGDVAVFYHPGGGIHKGSYYGFSSGKLGRNKIVGADYKPISGDKAKIFYNN